MFIFLFLALVISAPAFAMQTGPNMQGHKNLARVLVNNAKKTDPNAKCYFFFIPQSHPGYEYSRQAIIEFLNENLENGYCIAVNVENGISALVKMQNLEPNYLNLYQTNGTVPNVSEVNPHLVGAKIIAIKPTQASS